MCRAILGVSTENEEASTTKRAPKRPKSKPVVDDSDVEMGDEGKSAGSGGKTQHGGKKVVRRSRSCARCAETSRSCWWWAQGKSMTCTACTINKQKCLVDGKSAGKNGQEAGEVQEESTWGAVHGDEEAVGEEKGKRW